MNWLGVILIVIALILVFIVAIILSTTLKQGPGAGGSYNNSASYSYGFFTPYAGSLTVDSGKIVGATVLSWIAVVVLLISVFAVGARQTVTSGLSRLTSGTGFTVRT
jgi:hypothetical protein